MVDSGNESLYKAFFFQVFTQIKHLPHQEERDLPLFPQDGQILCSEDRLGSYHMLHRQSLFPLQYRGRAGRKGVDKEG